MCRVKGHQQEMVQDFGARQAGALSPFLSLGAEERERNRLSGVCSCVEGGKGLASRCHVLWERDAPIHSPPRGKAGGSLFSDLC